MTLAENIARVTAMLDGIGFDEPTQIVTGPSGAPVAETQVAEQMPEEGGILPLSVDSGNSGLATSANGRKRAPHVVHTLMSWAFKPLACGSADMSVKKPIEPGLARASLGGNVSRFGPVRGRASSRWRHWPIAGTP